jgi:hypothetical protein
MASVLRCDGCGKEIQDFDGHPTNTALGWWELRGIGPDVRRFGEPERRYHFCSLECVQGFALAMLARLEQRVPL